MIGASVAYHLAQRGVRDIVVLDRGEGPGGGSTAKATGGFRTQFDTPVNVRLSLLARGKLNAFADETGVDPGYVPVGYLWIASSTATMDTLRHALLVQQAEGLADAKEIGVEEIRQLNPAISLAGVVGGTWCPTDRSRRAGCGSRAARLPSPPGRNGTRSGRRRPRGRAQHGCDRGARCLGRGADASGLLGAG